MKVEVNGGSVYCEVTGKGPALFVPGYASTPRFSKTAQCFADEFTVIGCDVRGEGLDTDFSPEPYTVDDIADDCAGVLEALGFERAHFLGHSHTGMIGQSLALRHPGRVDRLLLTMTTPGLPPRDDDGHPLPVPEGEYTNAMIAAETGAPDGLRRLGALMLSAAAEQDPTLLDQCTECFVPVFAQTPEDRQRTWAAYGTFGVRDRLHEIQAPTLILMGSGDRMVEPEDCWVMWHAIPNCTLVALAGIGHDWLTEAPALGARVVTAFLRGEMDKAHAA